MSDLENSHRKSLKAAEDTIQLYADYWRRSLGHHLHGSPKGRSHEAFAQWLSDWTSNVVGDVDTARKIIAGVQKWQADAKVARTLGVPEPSVLTYLPIRIPNP